MGEIVSAVTITTNNVPHRRKVMKKTILIIDSDPTWFHLLKNAPVSEELLIISIQNTVNIYPSVHEYMPDLMIMEINLGPEDGRTLCNEIKADPELKHISVMLLTSLPYEKICEIECEADAILGKPIIVDNLLLTIGDLIYG